MFQLRPYPLNLPHNFSSTEFMLELLVLMFEDFPAVAMKHFLHFI